MSNGTTTTIVIASTTSQNTPYRRTYLMQAPDRGTPPTRHWIPVTSCHHATSFF